MLGGPEVSFDAKELLEAHPFLDGVLMGEGEASFADLVSKWSQNADFSNVKGFTFTDKNGVKSTPLPPLFDMDLLPFPYGEEELSSGKILYYESSRGCPFNCQYCLSSLDKKVRFRRVDLVLGDLQRFLDAKVKQVKFVDRTFNCKKSHAMAIWTYLAAHDNGVTNFHFELSADLLDEEMLDFLSTVRKGLFQFEIGIQSTNPKTIAAIDRRTDLPELFSIIRRINAPGNIHQHLDLIAGLPYEGLESFERSFNAVSYTHLVELFDKYDVYDRQEMAARYDIMLDIYTRRILIEARTMAEMARTQLYPAISRYLTEAAQAVKALGDIGKASRSQQDKLDCLISLLDSMDEDIVLLTDKIGRADGMKKDHEACAAFCAGEILPAMNDLRVVTDRLESMVDSRFWPIPTYSEILFNV